MSLIEVPGRQGLEFASPIPPILRAEAQNPYWNHLRKKVEGEEARCGIQELVILSMTIRAQSRLRIR